MNIEALSIDTIGLSARSTNALHREEIHTVGDMLGFTEESLLQVKNLGKKSVEEIVEKIKKYKLNAVCTERGMDSGEEKVFIPDNFDEWICEDVNKSVVREWLTENEIRIEALELLSARAFNLLMFAGYDYLYQIVFLSFEELMSISRMDEASAHEIGKVLTRFIRNSKEDICTYISEKNRKNPTIFDLLLRQDLHDVILQYVKANDIEIEKMGLSNRAKNRLLSNGYTNLSDIVFMERSELFRIPAMGNGSVDDVLRNIHIYLEENEQRMLAVISGDDSALWNDRFIREKILNLYPGVGFGGLSLAEILEKLDLPKQVTVERVKHIIGLLIADKELEYVDYRCYRVYGKFEDVLKNSIVIDDRSKTFIQRRLQGETLEAIALDTGLTRERVRQVVKASIKKVKNQYRLETGHELFDEDYYRYLYENYDFDKKDGAEWLGISVSVWNYLNLNDVKKGKKDLQTALEDHRGLEMGLRLKIKNYLNRNKIFVDGMWVEKRRSELEEVVVRKFCKDDVSFSEFIEIFNHFLRDEEIPYDEKLYYTEAVLRTRKNRLSDERFLLWKQNEQIRYYDIDGQDYSELLDTLNLASYENIELSTAKFMKDHAEVLERYDIRDQYELHNLLRKIVPEGSYHGFHCCRMPDIRFGEFDRDSAILDILIDNSPISIDDLVALISDEYGYDPRVIIANYLKNFSDYYHQGIYSIDQKQMSVENREILENALIDEFYYIDEIRRIYRELVPNADIEEINPYNLKNMGFQVYCRYALKNHSSLEEFFEELLTKDDIVDITAYRNRFAYIQSFSSTLSELRRNLQIIEYEPNQIINIRKLKRSGITLDMIQEYCDAAYEFVDDGEYFSAQSLRKAGFEAEMQEFGFSDWFYANLLISDERFSFGIMFGNMILFKGNERITTKTFITNRIREHGSIDAYDLMSELADEYGCIITEKREAIYKVQGTEVYYDKILDRLYANKDIYYAELEEGGF
uniref:DNA-directed RNA polymerase, alpha subunit/40 kD subunit n=1 Tax=Eubacterium cellulosolvens (strain ATCC 43171 / JCM 9499 / 6) TaxID=633697 RepID=I5AXJ0_EUBC6